MSSSDQSYPFLSFASFPPAAGGGGGSMIENEWHIIFLIIDGRNTNTGTSLEGCEKRIRHTVHEPHSHPIYLCTPIMLP
ncbi:hypothetical protein L6452_35131 [Arctium lappa]|uniref:Uncharacterized protein n=1 Tax=Arctium lappa TaxID=4217 RepID=A0ACB8YPC6_ARCLA|nr:hypothetical protein L6452_35131 [Arctium lappa]